jgi:DNA invertase Pin-like site-specific DNA recombinase
MKKAYGYLRVSSTGQIDGDGFPRQREAITAHAKANDIKIVKWFEEKGVSGTIADRPALQAMMLELLSDGVYIVLIEKLDRIARDLMIQEHLIEDFRKHGFELISAHEPDLCSDDPSRKLMRQIMGAIAAYDRTMIVLKLRAARERSKARTGRCEGRKPFGAKPDEQKTLLRIRELAKQGLNYTHIADKLNAENRETQAGGKWFPSTVSRTLNRK